MTLPVLLTSDMPGSPRLTPTNGSMNALLHACLVNGFNTQPVVSATASGGVVTFNFSTDPGFPALSTVAVAGASNATVNGKFRVQSAASNQVLVPIPGVPDGAVGGTITLKFAPLGWTRPYSGTGIGCYRQGGSATHKRFVRIYDNNLSANGYSGAIRGYENMTAVSTGTGPFPTTAQQQNANGHNIAIAYDYNNDAPAQQYKSWVVIGTPRFFMVYVRALEVTYGTGMTEPSPLSAANTGEIRAFGFGELADISKPGDAYASAVFYDYTGIFTPYVSRTVAGAANSADYLTCIGLSGSGYFANGVPWPNVADGGTHFFGAPHYYDRETPHGIRGSMPGAMMLLESPFGNTAPVPAQFAQILTNISGVNGRVMLLYAGVTYTDLGWRLDEDWGDV